MSCSHRGVIGILLGGVALLAQTNAPPAEPRASAVSQIEEAAKKHARQRGSSEPMEILTDTMGVDFKPYLSRVLHTVRQNWCSHIPESANFTKGWVTIDFYIMKDGAVQGLRVVDSSGDVTLDRPAFGSITMSNPFPPLPSEFTGQYLGLRFSYYYNLNPNDAGQQQLVGASCKEEFPVPLANNNPEARPSTKPAGVNDAADQIARTNKVPEAASSASTSYLKEALTLYRTGRFEEAAQKYEQLLQAEPISAEAYADLTRVYLKQNKLREAHETISKGLTVADSAHKHVALGEVLFRDGKIPEAEREWLGVTNSGHADARAHLGLARVSAAAALYKQAKREIDEAHRLDPDDPDIQFYWIRSQGLGAGLSDSRHECRLATDLVPAEMDLLLLGGDRSNQIRGYGLTVSVNGQNSKLLLDTGAHGIVIDRKIAQKAGLTKISDTTVSGFGDEHKSAGHFAMANSIKVGALEFRDCPVTVIDKGSVLGEDGLVGTDVFEQFLIDLDFPNKKLRLGDLPKRSEEDPTEVDYTSLANRRRPAGFSFSYTPVYRFAHLLLVPTQVGDSTEQSLFAIDTGAPRNVFSVGAARKVAQVTETSRLAIKGLSGAVKRVYDAEKTALYFANVQQYADKETALSLENMSEEIGTEVSGVLGVLNLRTLDVTIDYRDGFVGFDFNSNP